MCMTEKICKEEDAYNSIFVQLINEHAKILCAKAEMCARAHVTLLFNFG